MHLLLPANLRGRHDSHLSDNKNLPPAASSSPGCTQIQLRAAHDPEMDRIFLVPLIFKIIL